MAKSGGDPRSVTFRREREKAWRDLEQLMGIVERFGLRSLTASQATRLPVLYRSCVSALAVTRAISLDRNLRDYLEGLTARAYFCIYGAKRPLRSVLADFALRTLPAAVYRLRWMVLAASLCMAAGTAVGWVMVVADVDAYSGLMPEGMAGGRQPWTPTEDLREVLYSEGDLASGLSVFASFLFTNNAKVAMLSFALGFASGLPAVLLLFWNGVLLGAMSGLYHLRGLSPDFWGWVLPHGVTELGAIVLCGAAGLEAGRRLVFPGQHTRLAAMAQAGRQGAIVVAGGVAMLMLAALLEGFFRQLVHDMSTRYTVALFTTVAWALYFGFVGRRMSRS